MLARSVLRTAGKRTFRPTTITAPIQQRATFKSGSKKNEPEVPVISYENGTRTEQSIFVPAQQPGPVVPPGGDEQRVARPFNPDVMSHLTPTLAKFALTNKVAVVTG